MNNCTLYKKIQLHVIQIRSIALLEWQFIMCKYIKCSLYFINEKGRSRESLNIHLYLNNDENMPCTCNS